MLGVVENPLRTPSDEVMEKVADEMGVGDTFHPTPVGVFFGGPGAGAGRSRWPTRTSAAPARTATPADCGECMTGCRHNAKNTLVKNYLYLAEQHGATVLPADDGHPGRGRATGGGYDVHVRAGRRPSVARVRRRRTLTAEQVVFAAAVARHPAAAAPDASDEGDLPRLSRPARLPIPDQLRVDPRRDRPRHLGRLQPGRRDHLALPPRRAHPHRAGAATARAATRCR